MKNLIFIFLLLGVVLPESELLRSKYLTEDMIQDIERLNQYNKKAKLIFNKYEKAKFYQIVAYTYYLKYQQLTEELNSLERQYSAQQVCVLSCLFNLHPFVCFTRSVHSNSK